MKTLTPTTELEAVNTMLLNIGSDSISSLLDDKDADVSAALHTLHRVSRQVQTSGWDFNTEVDYLLSYSLNSGEIRFPRNALSFDVKHRAVDKRNLVMRGNRLYDRKNHTYQFSNNVTVDLIVFLDFEELPPSARDYISLRASREFQNDVSPTDDGERDASIEELRAYAQFTRDHGRNGRFNILGGRKINGRNY